MLQTHSRKYSIPIDHLVFNFTVLESGKREFNRKPNDGVYVYGLYLDGARWDKEENALSEQNPGELYSEMPVIHFLPIDTDVQKEFYYECPVYKTSVRAGVLSTTGQSTNFILSVDLPSEDPQEHWILRGAALLCQLND